MIGGTVRGTCLAAPVDRPLLDRFVAPSCPYCAGRRTLGFGARAGDVVRSPVSGRVHFVGEVVGVGYLTVTPAEDSSLMVTVGGMDPSSGAPPGEERSASPLAPGTLVVAGRAIGTATGPVTLSMRRRSPPAPDLYLDPEPYLARWRFPARLVPVADPGPTDAPHRVARADFGCRRGLNGGAADAPPR